MAGRLSLLNVAMEMIVPREVPADNWSLVEIRGNQSVRLERCWLTIRNASDQFGAYHQEVAFFRVRAAPDADVENDDAGAAAESAAIDLIDCIGPGRGHAAPRRRLAAGSPAPGTTACWLTSERLLSAIGGAKRAADRRGRAARSAAPDGRGPRRAGPAGRQCRPIRTNLPRRSTVPTRSCRRPPAARWSSRSADGDLDELRDGVAWSGDRNFYEGFDVFWAFAGSTPTTAAGRDDRRCLEVVLGDGARESAAVRQDRVAEAAAGRSAAASPRRGRLRLERRGRPIRPGAWPATATTPAVCSTVCRRRRPRTLRRRNGPAVWSPRPVRPFAAGRCRVWRRGRDLPERFRLGAAVNNGVGNHGEISARIRSFQFLNRHDNAAALCSQLRRRDNTGSHQFPLWLRVGGVGVVANNEPGAVLRRNSRNCRASLQSISPEPP